MPKVALITGAARRIGRQLTKQLHSSGYNIVLHYRSSEHEANIIADKLNLVRPKSVYCCQANLSDLTSITQLAEQALEPWGRLDVLINNAGVIQQGFTATQDLSVDEWDHVMDINLKGTFLCCKHIGKIMLNAGGGSIVNIASTAGITGIPRAPAYCASKSGVILLTKSLALEWARHNIRVNAIAPHYLETGLTKDVRESKKIHTAIVKQIPLGRLGKTSEVFGAVLYLASAASTYTTGAVIPVDGGFLAQ